jgi:hypothetical protein
MAAMTSVALVAAALAQSPLGTASTYQGVLKQAGVPLNGNDLADIQAVLYDAATGGSQVGSAVVVSNVDFEQGRFTILLDFGLSPFGGDARWLQLLVRKPPGTGQWVTLTPRQPLTATPYGLFAVTALDADLLEGQPAAFYQNASNLNAGTLGSARLSGTYTNALVLPNAANSFTGVGTGLTGLNATNVASGTLADGRLSANVALLNAAQTFTANKYFSGNVGIGTTSPAYKLDVSGTARVAGTGSGSANLIIHDSNGSNDRPGIQFTNNSMHYLCGDDVSDESFGLYSVFGNNRAFGAVLTVHGPATSSWGNYIGLKHDGSDGFVYTDVGDLVLDPLGNVGIDQVNPTQKLDVNGTVKMTGFQLGTSTTAGYVLTANASGVGTWQQAAPGGGIGGSGTANYIPKFTGPTAIGDSVIYDSGGNVGIGDITPDAKLDVEGALRAGGASEWVQLDNTGANGVGMTMRAQWHPGPPAQYGRADVRNDNGTLRLLTTNTDGDPPNTNGITITTAGNVGIGIAAATAARLDLLTSATNYGIRAENASPTGTGLFAMGGTDGHAADLRGRLRVFHRSTNKEVFRAGFSDVGGGAVNLWNANNVATVEIDADESSTGGRGADIGLYNSAGQRTICLDADYDNTNVGRVITDVLQITGGSDLSEQFDVSVADRTPEPGMVVVIDPEQPGQLRVATAAYERTVAGVISGAGGVKPGMLMGQRDSAADGQHPVALTGRVYVWCDASAGAIGPGDLLTTSSTPGHAMRVAEDQAAPRGCIIGKAMSTLDSGRGLVLVLIQPQ